MTPGVQPSARAVSLHDPLILDAETAPTLSHEAAGVLARIIRAHRDQAGSTSAQSGAACVADGPSVEGHSAA